MKCTLHWLANFPPSLKTRALAKFWVPNHSKPCVCVHIISIYDICRYQIMTLYSMRYTLLYSYNSVNIYTYTQNYCQYESLRDGCIATSTFGPEHGTFAALAKGDHGLQAVQSSAMIRESRESMRIFSAHWIQHYIARKYHWGIMTGGVICRFKKHDYLDP